MDGDSAVRQELEERTGQRTVPQIFVGSTHVGGFKELRAASQSGELDALLQREGIERS